jgi:hypothetical protein
MARLPGCEIPSAVHIIKRNFYYLIDSGTTQPTCDMQSGGAACDMQYASKWDRCTLALVGTEGLMRATPGSRKAGSLACSG